jgi:hypothetical protein
VKTLGHYWMNMKTLDIEKLSSVAGAEPHGKNTEGHQNDGYDIVTSFAALSDMVRGHKFYDVYVSYDDYSTWRYNADRSKPFRVKGVDRS